MKPLSDYFWDDDWILIRVKDIVPGSLILKRYTVHTDVGTTLLYEYLFIISVELGLADLLRITYLCSGKLTTFVGKKTDRFELTDWLIEPWQDECL